jgi:hypothetical protein
MGSSYNRGTMRRRGLENKEREREREREKREERNRNNQT